MYRNSLVLSGDQENNFSQEVTLFSLTTTLFSRSTPIQYHTSLEKSTTTIMQFPAIYSSTFFLFILASTKLVASAPLPYNNLNSEEINIPAGVQSAPKLPVNAVPECEVPDVTPVLPTLL